MSDVIVGVFIGAVSIFIMFGITKYFDYLKT